MHQDYPHAYARILWEKGWGSALGMADENDYFASIPKAPSDTEVENSRFPLLVLVDGRLPLRSACRFAGIDFRGNRETFIASALRAAEDPPVYWMRCQDGKSALNRNRDDVLREFVAGECVLTAIEGVCLAAQYPDIMHANYDLELAGSVCHLGEADHFANLIWENPRAECINLPDQPVGLSLQYAVECRFPSPCTGLPTRLR